MDRIELPGTEVVLEEATAEDLPALIGLLSDDILGASRDGIRSEEDKQRKDAHRFYERLGFERRHEGFKLVLGTD
ncbi:hypothetical protein M3E18_01235 [Kocuria sp. p3-SID1433]|uniref:hypothetical protein n=1 Tax=unclassified Kocuria TaxID=2649579 RepID=UPI0021A7B56E|nr:MULTISPECIES: hypothetical protein [unclassified Kocuria]MCT1600858.1 hypothetical protein [Kocuria sp. p3-SID1428]MCT2179181.1 hypothetical protein [Kocuria sp. p3-SID1433]